MLGKTRPPPTSARQPNRSPHSASSTREGQSWSARVPRAASSPGSARGAGRQPGGPAVADASLDAHPEISIARSGERGNRPAQGTGSKQQGAPAEAWARGQALQGQVSQGRCSPAPAPRCPRLPRAGNAQALPVNEAAAPAKSGVAVSAPTTRHRQRAALRDRSREKPQVPWLLRAQWPPRLPQLLSANRRSHRHLRISLWWEKRGGGTAEGATRRETCAVSSATAARGRNSPGREPQCDPRARPESCDPLESVVSPLAPEPGVESTNEPPETTYPRMPAGSRVTRSRSFATRDVTTNPSMLCASGSSTRKARPLRKWLETYFGRWKTRGGAISFSLGRGLGGMGASP